MSSPNFTPGPWEVIRIPEENYNRLAVEQIKSKLILVTHTFDGIEAEANTRLMAAAPDMYWSLEYILTLFEYIPQDTVVLEMMSAAEKALAKARGENHD